MTMHPPPHAEPPVATFLYYMDSCLTHILQAEELGELTSSEYTLLIFRSGTNRIYLNGRNKLVNPLAAFLLKPGSSCQFENIDGLAVSYDLIQFRVFEQPSAQPLRYSGELFPGRDELHVAPLSDWSVGLEALSEATKDHTAMGAFNRQVRFQQVLAYLLQHNSQEQQGAQWLHETIRYMEQHFQEPITVRKLAELVQIPPWKYTSMFREWTGLKPLDYLTDLRIARAKELLSHPDFPLREIARLSGFADEYYFNRRFRALTGMTPRQFSKSTEFQITLTDWTGHQVQAPRQPKNIVYLGEYAEDLQVLGITPSGCKNVAGKSSRKLAAEAAALGPDLMILTHSNERLYSQISKIGPTLTHNTHDSVENRLIALGEWLDKSKEASRWLSDYQAAVKGMWRQLGSFIRQGETTSVITIDRGDRLFVMGAIGLSAFLFHQEGFQPAGKTKEIVQTGRPYREIKAALLPLYTGDRIFAIRSEEQKSAEGLDRLMESSLWRSLPAAAQGRVHLLEESWNYGSALAQQRLVQQLPALLAGSNRQPAALARQL